MAMTKNNSALTPQTPNLKLTRFSSKVSDDKQHQMRTNEVNK